MALKIFDPLIINTLIADAKSYLIDDVIIGSTDLATEKLDVVGRVRIRNIGNAAGDFLTVSPTGLISKRTAAEVLSDIGAGGGGGGGDVPSTRLLTAGDGLTGGGDLSADRTFTLGTPSTLTVSTINSVTATSHTHVLDLSGRTITAGDGLSGGGNLSADRTLSFDTIWGDNRYVITSVLGNYQLLSEKGEAEGYVPLDVNGKIPTLYIPDSILGQVRYMGTWDVTTNTPTLINPPASTTLGEYYVVVNSGTFAGLNFSEGDWIISKGDSWQKVDNTDAVTTVFGRLGPILAIESDYQAFYPRLSQSYSNPTWISDLAWTKITGTPTTLSGYGITDAVETARTSISLTTTGNSGASSYSDITGVFNVPEYTLEGLGGSPSTIINVMDYGVIGDGVANDTVGIQNALNDVALSEKWVYFPKGDYLISSTLELLVNTKILGYGAKIFSTTGHFKHLNLNSDTIIKGLEIVGTGFTIAVSGDEGISVVGTVNDYKKNIELVDLTITNCGFYGIFMQFVDGFNITRCKVFNLGYAGIMGLSVKNGMVFRSWIKEIDYPEGGYNISFTRDTIVDTLLVNPRSENCIVQDCLIEDNLQWKGLDVHAGDNVRFINNTVLNCRQGIGVVGSGNFAPRNCKVHNNTIITTRGTLVQSGEAYGIAVAGIGGADLTTSEDYAENCSIIGNIINGGGTEGNLNSGAIRIRNTRNTIITNNKVINPIINGINIQHTNYNFIVSNNTVEDPNSSDAGINTMAIIVSSQYNEGVINGNTLRLNDPLLNVKVGDRGIHISTIVGNKLIIKNNQNNLILKESIPYSRDIVSDRLFPDGIRINKESSASNTQIEFNEGFFFRANNIGGQNIDDLRSFWVQGAVGTTIYVSPGSGSYKWISLNSETVDITGGKLRIAGTNTLEPTGSTFNVSGLANSGNVFRNGIHYTTISSGLANNYPENGGLSIVTKSTDSRIFEQFANTSGSLWYRSLTTNADNVWHKVATDTQLTSTNITGASFDGTSSIGNRLTLTRVAGNLTTTFKKQFVLDTREAVVDGSTGAVDYLPNPNDAFWDNGLTAIFRQGWGGNSWGSSIVMKGWNTDYQPWMISGPSSQGAVQEEWYLRSSNPVADTWETSRRIWHAGNLRSDTDNDGRYVRLTTNQTVAGQKIFSDAFAVTADATFSTVTTVLGEFRAKQIGGNLAITLYEGNSNVRAWSFYNISSPNYDFALTRLGGFNTQGLVLRINRLTNNWIVTAGTYTINTTNLSNSFHITIDGDVGIGTITPNEKLEVNGNIRVSKGLLSNQENLDVDSGAIRVIATVPSATYDATFFDFVIKKGTNLRSGTLYVVHDGTNVEFTETSTMDLGNTGEVVLSTDISGGNIRLLATTVTDNWIIKTLIRGL